MESKSNTGFVIVVILLVLIVIGLTGYIVYDKVLDGNGDNVTVKQSESKDNEEKQVDADKLGRELFEKYGDYIYANNSLNYNNLDNSLKMEIALINTEDIIYNRNFSYGEQDEKGYYEYYLKLSISNFEDAYKDVFGVNKSISYENFIILNSLSESAPAPLECMREDKYIVCYPFDGGGLLDGYFYYDYDYSELKNDKLYVYVNHLHVDLDNNVYSDYDGNNSLGMTSGDTSNLFTKYKGKTGVYKVVFSKDVNDSWIWEETQIVKE